MKNIVTCLSFFFVSSFFVTYPVKANTPSAATSDEATSSSRTPSDESLSKSTAQEKCETPSQENVEALTEQAKDFIRDMGSRAINVLTTKDNPLETKKEFEKIFVDHFAVQGIATFVLGRYVRRASDAEKRDFFELFKKSIADIYAERFKHYTNESFYVTRASYSPGARGDASIRVFSEVSKEGSPPIVVEWRVSSVYRHNQCEFLISDVTVEGLSMSITQRSEYSSIIDREGSVAGLNKILRQKLKESGIVSEAKTPEPAGAETATAA